MNVRAVVNVLITRVETQDAKERELKAKYEEKLWARALYVTNEIGAEAVCAAYLPSIPSRDHFADTKKTFGKMLSRISTNPGIECHPL